MTKILLDADTNLWRKRAGGIPMSKCANCGQEVEQRTSPPFINSWQHKEWKIESIGCTNPEPEAKQ